MTNTQRILVAVVEAILGPVDPPPQETSFFVTFEQTLQKLPKRDRRAVGWLLNGIQLSPILYFRGKNFTGLSPTDREAHLVKLSRSRMGMLRRGVFALKGLVTYSYYGQPEAWRGIGYGGPWLGREFVEAYDDPDLGRSS